MASPGTQAPAVDRAMLKTAAQLVAKAESTPLDPEAVAFVERAYRLLAQVITAYDIQCGESDFGPRRRERRQLRDRRAGRPRGGSERAVAAANPILNYRNFKAVLPSPAGGEMDRQL